MTTRVNFSLLNSLISWWRLTKRNHLLYSLGLQNLAITWIKPEKIDKYWISLAQIQAHLTAHFPKGMGIDLDRGLAQKKSLMEALEELACLETPNLKLENRSGVAAHFDLKQAKQNAYQELIERDALLFHWLGEVPFLHLKEKPIYIQQENETINPQIYELISADPTLKVCIALSQSKEYGCWHIGLGCNASLEKSIKKALTEYVTSLFTHQIAKNCPAKKLSSNANPNTLAVASHHLATHENSVNEFFNFLTTPEDESNFMTETDSQIQKTTFRSLKTRSPHYHVVHAHSSILLPLLFGKSYLQNIPQYLKNKRLNEIIKEKKLVFQTPNKTLLHPLD